MPSRLAVLSFLRPFSAPLLVAAVVACGPTTTGPSGDGDGDDDGGTDVAECVLDGVEVSTPPGPAALPSGSAPDFSCVGAPEVVGAGTTATVQGCIDIFGIGEKAKPGLKVAVFSADQDPGTDTPAYGETDVAVAAEAGPLQDLANACPYEGYYRIDGVPTHAPLIFKTYETDTGPQQTVMPTYTYDVFFRNDEIDDDDAITYEANYIYRSTYDSIPTLGGQRVQGQSNISDGVGRGVIAGEIHDCQDRLVKNAVVGTSQADNDTATRYFNGDVEDPKPDLTINATNDDGLYTHLNASTDPATNEHLIVAGVQDPDCEGDDCQCVLVGSSTVRVYPDAVTILTLRGDLPVVE